jgi:hypothetical protein
MLSFYGFDSRTWKKWQAMAEQCRRLLTEQPITPAGPGSILKDVDSFLEFVGTEGIATKNRSNTLPIGRLMELNQKSSYPVELTLKRALLRDYPNLAGIFVLLRVMDLLQVKGPRLTVCPTALEFWRGLNCTEQYFALLEALLFQAHPSVLANERRYEEMRSFELIPVFLAQLSDRWRSFDHYESVSHLGPKGDIRPWNVLLLQQLGLIEIRPRLVSEKERRGWGGGGWLLGGARLTPWGAAINWPLMELQRAEEEELEELADDPENRLPQPGPAQGLLVPLLGPTATERANAGEDSDAEDFELALDESSDDSGEEAAFGSLQPTFQPYRPEWRTVYARPKLEIRSGTHHFKVTLAGWQGQGGGIWRRLLVPPHASLDTLAAAILGAFDFDSDHLYDFRYRDQRGTSRIYNHPETDEGPYTPEITVAETELPLKDEMLFTFDYGDNWQFKVRLEAVEDAPCKFKHPKISESAGKAPDQYPNAES